MLRAVSLLSLATFTAACGDVGLDLVDPPAPPADVEQVPEPTICDENPELPSPVKVVFLVDLSGSMQFTDQANARVPAMQQFADGLNSDVVSVATLGFGSNVYVDPPPSADGPRFIRPDEWTPPQFLAAKDVTTDLQGALDGARQYILADALAQPLEVRQRTRYVVLLFTDGTASPSCCVEADEVVGEITDEWGCPLEPWEVSQAGVRYCASETELDLCNDPAFLTQFREGALDVAFEEATLDGPPPVLDLGAGPLTPLHAFELGGNYNRKAELEDAVRVLKSVEAAGVGRVELHGVLLTDPTLPDAVKEIFRLNACRMERTVSTMTGIGTGTTHLFSSSLALDFTVISTASLCPVSEPAQQ